MLSFNNYQRPESLDEAYEILNKHKRSQLIGGGAFLRMGQRRLTHVIDISQLDLETISTSEHTVEIGSMSTFHTLETSESLPTMHRNYFKDALGQIVGIQLRNMVTVGGTVFSRYGFSDLNTALLALGGAVHLHKNGVKDIESFFEQALPDRDVLTKVEIPNTFEAGVFKSARLSTADYALLNLALVKNDGKYRIAVGARPHRAKLAHNTMEYLNTKPLSAQIIDEACSLLASEIPFGSNRLASASYRKAVSGGLLKEALTQIMNENTQEVMSGEN
jgi:CO/xanthine dehydrogenase FAD-binding subunit